MLFPSIPFLLYFLPAALLLYWVCPRALRNPALLLISLVFYAWGEPRVLLPMLFLVVVNYALGRMLGAADTPGRRRRIVQWAAFLNIAALLIVVRGEAVARTVATWLELPLPDFHLPAPLGMAFFTLQALTYVIEIARGKVAPDRNIVNVGLFIAFFPTVLFGPIVNYSDLASQIRERKMTWELFGAGWERLVVGFAKLVVLAVPLGNMATDIFAFSAMGLELRPTPVALAWLGVAAFGLQFYLAFSGYSDIALGLARMFGFRLRENFRYPYAAHTVADFWSRWHISLYRWFFAYVFIALGGRRPKLVRIRKRTRARNNALRNYFVMWMLFGFWHGMNWNALVFGFWFFVFAFFEWVVSLQRKNTGNPLFSLYVLPVVAVGWVFLRCASLSESTTYISNLLGMNANGFYSDFVGVYAREYWPVLLLGVLASTPLANRVLGWLRRERSVAAGYFLGACHALIMLGLLALCCVFAGEIPSGPLVVFK